MRSKFQQMTPTPKVFRSINKFPCSCIMLSRRRCENKSDLFVVLRPVNYAPLIRWWFRFSWWYSVWPRLYRLAFGGEISCFWLGRMQNRPREGPDIADSRISRLTRPTRSTRKYKYAGQIPEYSAFSSKRPLFEKLGRLVVVLAERVNGMQMSALFWRIFGGQ